MTDLYSLIGAVKPFNLSEYVYTLIDKNSPLSYSNKYTIYIPSKGRATIGKTARSLGQLKYVMVVEPQDYHSYCAVYPPEQIVCLDKNDQGLAYARNYIKTYSREIGEDWHWQMDDDVERFQVRKRGASKNETVDALTCISIVEHCTDMYSNIAISGISSHVFAFSKQHPVHKNRLAYGCVLVNNHTDLTWEMSGTEDWHYTFSALETGYCTLAFYHVTMQTASTMTLPGGCTQMNYSGDKRKLLYQDFIKRWPGRFRLKEYPDSRKRWRLQAVRRFFNDYKQNLILKTS